MHAHRLTALMVRHQFNSAVMAWTEAVTALLQPAFQTVASTPLPTMGALGAYRVEWPHSLIMPELFSYFQQARFDAGSLSLDPAVASHLSAPASATPFSPLVLSPAPASSPAVGPTSGMGGGLPLSSDLPGASSAVHVPLGTPVPSFVAAMPWRLGVSRALMSEGRFGLLRTEGRSWCPYVFAGNSCRRDGCDMFHQDPSAVTVTQLSASATPASLPDNGSRKRGRGST
jgi:hypothetical protein